MISFISGPFLKKEPCKLMLKHGIKNYFENFKHLLPVKIQHKQSW